MFKKSTFFIIALMSVKPIFAIPCPDINLVKQSQNKIDEAYIVGSRFTAFSIMPTIRFNNSSWNISVIEIDTDTKAKAIQIAKDTIPQVTSGDWLANDDGGSYYRCVYEPGKVVLVSKKLSF